VCTVCRRTSANDRDLQEVKKDREEAFGRGFEFDHMHCVFTRMIFAERGIMVSLTVQLQDARVLILLLSSFCCSPPIHHFSVLSQALNRSMNPNFWDASNLTGGSSNGSSGGSSTSGGGATLGGATAPQGASERRAAAAAAAEARQQDWRQGGSKDAAKGAAVAQRRQKV